MYKVKVRSHYNWTIEELKGKKFIVILDENRGGIPVTDDIDNVVEQICIDDKIRAQDHLIIYKDIDGIWDGWDYATQSFVHLHCVKKSEAIEKFIARTK